MAIEAHYGGAEECGMRLTVRVLSAAAMLVLATAGLADNTLSVTARVVGSVLLSIENAGQAIAAPGTVTLDARLGSVATPEASVSFVRNGKQAKFSSTIRARALKANLASSQYALTARLLHALPAGVEWRVNGVAPSDTSAAIVTTAAFGANGDLSWEIVVDESSAAARLDNAIVFTVVPR
jgi:hypothetical protein